MLILAVSAITGLFIILVSIRREESRTRRENMPRGRVEKYWDGSERRRFVRFESELDLKYNIRKSCRMDPAKTRDISEGGMRMLADQKLESGTIVDMEIPQSDDAQPICLEGVITWCNEAKDRREGQGKRFFHVGVKFTGVKKSSEYGFGNLMRSLEDVLRKRAVLDEFSVNT